MTTQHATKLYFAANAGLPAMTPVAPGSPVATSLPTATATPVSTAVPTASPTVTASPVLIPGASVPVFAPAPAPAPEGSACSDIPPAGGLTCHEQVDNTLLSKQL